MKTVWMMMALTVLGTIAPGPAKAADPVYIDAFTYQVETIEQAYALQQGLCAFFRYEPMIFDEVYVEECMMANGMWEPESEVVPPVKYTLEELQADPWCESVPVIVNPENCPDYANRKMVAWFDMVIEKNDKILWADIEAYIEAAKAAAKAAKGTAKIKENK